MSPARPLIRLALMLMTVGCAPALAGPDVPRPVAPPPVVTSTTIPTTTTTIDPADIMASQCPVEFCLVYEIREDAAWSNGAPVTPEDFVRTAELFSDPLITPPSPGYDQIETIDVIDEDRFRVQFSEPFGAWQQLFSRVIPVGADPGDVTGLPTTGAFRFVERVPGDRIVVRRDTAWWSEVDLLTGEPLGSVDEIVFVFYPDPVEMLDALEEGVVDVITTRPDLQTVERITGMEEITYVTAPGPFWEHIDFHHEDPLLAQPWVREAMTLAIDREEILDRTIRLLDPAAPSLDNTIWMGNTSHYQDHYDRAFDPVAAERILAGNGCERDSDGVQICDGRRMSLVWATTDDDSARAEVFESVREDLEAVGIEIVGDFRSPSQFVTRDFLFGGPETWQMIEFSWRLGSDPFTQSESYYCGQFDLNVNRFCSEDVEGLVREAARTPDPERRAELYNEADRLYLESDALIPLYQKPVLLAWAPTVTGLAPNWSYSTDMWNVASWSGEESIVVALPSEPMALDPSNSADESANAVLSTLFYGALGMTPLHDYQPVLVSSVQVVEG